MSMRKELIFGGALDEWLVWKEAYGEDKACQRDQDIPNYEKKCLVSHDVQGCEADGTLSLFMVPWSVAVQAGCVIGSPEAQLCTIETC